MSAHTPQEIVQGVSTIPDQHHLKMAAWVTALVVAAILVGYHETTWSMISIWERSDTFAHGFLIFPFSAYLIWGRRHHLATLPSRPCPLALAALGVLGFCWLLSTLASVQVLEQYFLIAMIPVAVWVILGTRMAWALAFPLAYLLLAVPFGDVLIPPLIDFTADFTVRALQLTGIPVYREGSFFTIPTGNWSVVEACSGLRYLIASFTLGTLYAYLTYRSLKRRLGFIALSVIVPIVANGIRAYLIVMTGHLSDMRLAVGVDHLIYGWVFFGVVMLVLFWIGSFWREDDEAGEDAGTISRSGSHSGLEVADAPLGGTLLASGAVLLIALVWPAAADYLDDRFSRSTAPQVEIPVASGEWRAATEPASDWKPVYVGATAGYLRSYRSSDGSVDLYVHYYRNQRQGEELVNTENLLVPEMGSRWRNVGESTRSIARGSRSMTVRQSQLHAPARRLLVWRWYWVGGEETASPYMAKFLLARNRLLGRGDDGAEIVLATPYEEDPEEATPSLQAFVDHMAPALTEGLRHAWQH